MLDVFREIALYDCELFGAWRQCGLGIARVAWMRFLHPGFLASINDDPGCKKRIQATNATAA
jgi:hypothetical protein